MGALVSLYGWALREATAKAVKAWPLALSSVLYFAILLLAVRLVGPLGLAGGFILGLLQAACISSYLYLLGQAVAGNRLRLLDLKTSFLALLNDVIGVLFILWIAGWVVERAARSAGDHREFLTATYGLAVAVFLNPVPEIIYQGRAPGRSLELLADSGRFIQQHWIEWFLPNLLIGLAALLLAEGSAALSAATLTQTLPAMFTLQGAFVLGASLLAGRELWTWPLILAVVHLAMIFRGLLFRELVTGNWRARAFRARTR